MITDPKVRMGIAIQAMCALLQKDFKNIGFSAYNSGSKSSADYIADQAFVLADAMLAREDKKEDKHEE